MTQVFNGAPKENLSPCGLQTLFVKLWLCVEEKLFNTLQPGLLAPLCGTANNVPGSTHSECQQNHAVLRII